MTNPSPDPSIEGEPHFHDRPFTPGPGDQGGPPATRRSTQEHLEHSVWEEPGLSPELAGSPSPYVLTYSSWLEDRIRQTSILKTWLVALAVSLAAGPWAILTALLSPGRGAWGLANLLLFAPLLEEIGKVAVAWMVVEKRPYLFSSRAQLALCVLAGGAVFAAIENLLYLYVYIPHPPPTLVTFRWTVCVALHTGCALIAGMGVMRIWAHAISRRTKPNLALGFPYLVTAVTIHGAYNGLAIVLESTAFGF